MNLVIKRSSPKSYIVNEGHKDFGSFLRGFFFFFGKINIFLHGELATCIYIVEEIQQFFFKNLEFWLLKTSKAHDFSTF
jgi:hypothetical protein